MTGAEIAIIALLAASTTVGVVSTVEQGKQAKAQGEAAEEIARANAEQQEREAKSRLDAAKIQEGRLSKQERIIKAQQRADFAASGVTLTGSPLDVLLETAGTFAEERALTLRSGLLGEQQLTSQAAITTAGGKLSANIGRAAQRGSLLTATGQGLGGAGRIGIAAGGLDGLNKTGNLNKINQGITPTNTNRGIA